LFDQYIKEHGSRLFGLTLKLCKNREDAEDLYQETWVKAYRFFDTYNSEYAFEPWLTGICVNTYRNMLKRNRWRSLLATFQSNEEKDFIVENIPAPQAEDYSEVREAVNALPEKYRVAVILHYYNDMDIRRTAETLGIPEGTVKYHLHKARELLKRSLGDG